METKSDVEGAVRDRYSAGAEAVEPALCCPIDYQPRYLEALPQEILDRDYGCGDPSAWVHPGDVVLDLGSGGGKICYIAAQIVGPTGRVIGVDKNEEMLALAERYKAEVAGRIGHDVVEFRKGRIQDLRLDLARVEAWLAANPVDTLEGLRQLEAFQERIAREQPLVADASVDIVLSNCVLNLVATAAKRQLFEEMFRVLKVGGRVAVADIVSDEEVPERLQRDPALWSGCISGAFREDDFLRAFEAAGFHGIKIEKRDAAPWRVVEGIEFRSMTVTAWKGKQGPCLERRQAVVYKGPWRRVVDDDGHTFVRGERAAVCDKTFRIMTGEAGPYAGQLEAIEPYQPVPLEEAADFDCARKAPRHPRETKGEDYAVTEAGGEGACGPTSCC